MASPSIPKKPYTSADRVKDAVLDAGRKLLVAQGPAATSGIDVKLKDAIVAADVPKTSAYRVFSDDEHSPQSMFSSELVRSLLTSGNHTDPAVTLDAAGEVLDAHVGSLAEGTDQDRAVVLRELVRVATSVNNAQLAESIDFRIFVVVLASCSGPGVQVDPSIIDTVIGMEAEGSGFRTFYEELASLFGLQLRPGWTWSAFDAVATGASYGSALREGHNPHTPIMRPTGPNGEDQEWSVVGVLLEGLILTATERAADAARSADLSTWLNC